MNVQVLELEGSAKVGLKKKPLMIVLFAISESYLLPDACDPCGVFSIAYTTVCLRGTGD